MVFMIVPHHSHQVCIVIIFLLYVISRKNKFNVKLQAYLEKIGIKEE